MQSGRARRAQPAAAPLSASSPTVPVCVSGISCSSVLSSFSWKMLNSKEVHSNRCTNTSTSILLSIDITGQGYITHRADL